MLLLVSFNRLKIISIGTSDTAFKYLRNIFVLLGLSMYNSLVKTAKANTSLEGINGRVFEAALNNFNCEVSAPNLITEHP